MKNIEKREKNTLHNTKQTQRTKEKQTMRKTHTPKQGTKRKNERGKTQQNSTKHKT